MYKIWVDLILHLEFGFFTWIWIVKQWLMLIYFYFELIWICISATTCVFGGAVLYASVTEAYRNTLHNWCRVVSPPSKEKGSVLPFHLEVEPQNPFCPAVGPCCQREGVGSSEPPLGLRWAGGCSSQLAHVPLANGMCGLWPTSSFLVKLCFISTIKKAEQISARSQVWVSLQTTNLQFAGLVLESLGSSPCL